LWFGPQSEYANVSADIDHRIVDLQFETVRVLPAIKGFPPQVFGDGPYCCGGEVTAFPLGSSSTRLSFIPDLPTLEKRKARSLSCSADTKRLS
jgi:hypothetical protein